MSGVLSAMVKKGYMPLAGNSFTAIGWQGKRLEDFWMWTGRYVEDGDGNKIKHTVKVESLSEAALHYWRDKWVPLGEVTDELLTEMEETLRANRGLKGEGVSFPDGEFLMMPGEE